jgi:two-component system CheB/CheR fusion protein
VKEDQVQTDGGIKTRFKHLSCEFISPPEQGNYPMTGKKEKEDPTTGKVSALTGPAEFPIVGIGASAGGLEAFEHFFKAMVANPGMAFVLVVHLAPTHVSILPELLQKKTKMKVLQVTDNMKVQPDHVYIIPPNKELAILTGSLQLMDLVKSQGVNLPIDSFLRSLAQDQGSNAICIILSGTGTDGTLGLRTVKGEGGMAMVQDEESAQYEGMPRSAIATGLADYVLPVDKIPEQLLKYVKHASHTAAASVYGLHEKADKGLKKIFLLLRTATGHDFSLYKKNTIFRRIERRMHVQQLDDVESYVRYLQESERELGVLFKELLIGVTSFFRDGKAFDLLREKYLPELLEAKSSDSPVRVWVPGCSRGEEVYSIAIILQECMERMGLQFDVQIFGTDIDEEAIYAARAGVYPDSIAADISQERLGKFFTREDNHFRVKRQIRDMVVFAPQNVIKDPPFTKLDMLSCRNLLIYFGPELQKKILPLFHYSLKEDGILFLGSSETTGRSNELFTSLDNKWKIFRSIGKLHSGRPVLFFSTSGPELQPQGEDVPGKPAQIEDVITLKLLKSVLAQGEMPPCAVIDELANIIYIHGRIGRYLEPAEGVTNNHILDMARPGLKAALASAINRTRTSTQEVVVKGLQVKDNGGFIDVNLIVRPLPHYHTGVRGMIMVIFEPVAQDLTTKAKVYQPKQRKNIDELEKLEDELKFTKDNLQNSIEEFETSNEELKSTNEELQSTNEELQSSNEELETSKEELQSLNEESITVNAELQSRMDEMVRANDDLKNLLDATEVAAIFLDIDLRIRRFTPQVTEIFPLTKADIGRPIQHFVSNLIDVDLESCSREVLTDLGIRETEVQDNDGKTYSMRVRPYRTINNVIDGVVITFADITRSKKIES